MLRGLVKVPQPVVTADNETEGSQRAPHRGSDSNARKKGGGEFQDCVAFGRPRGCWVDSSVGAATSAPLVRE